MREGFQPPPHPQTRGESAAPGNEETPSEDKTRSFVCLLSLKLTGANGYLVDF